MKYFIVTIGDMKKTMTYVHSAKTRSELYIDLFKMKTNIFMIQEITSEELYELGTGLEKTD